MQRRDAAAISVFLTFIVFQTVYEWYAYPLEASLARGLYAFSDGVQVGFAALGVGAWWWARGRGRVRMGRRHWAKAAAMAVAAWLALASLFTVYEYLYFASVPEYQGLDLLQLIVPVYLPFSLKWSAIFVWQVGLLLVLAAAGVVYAVGVLSRTIGSQSIADIPKVSPALRSGRGDPGGFRRYQARLLGRLYSIPPSLDTRRTRLRPRRMGKEFPRDRFRRMVRRCMLLVFFMALLVGLNQELTPYLGAMTTFLGFFSLMMLLPPLVVIASELLNSTGVEIPGTLDAHRLGDGLWNTFAGLVVGVSVIYSAARVVMTDVPLNEVVMPLAYYLAVSIPFSLVACWYYLNFAERDLQKDLTRAAKAAGLRT